VEDRAKAAHDCAYRNGSIPDCSLPARNVSSSRRALNIRARPIPLTLSQSNHTLQSSEYLEQPETQASFLSHFLKEGGTDEIRAAINTVARVRDMTKIANQSDPDNRSDNRRCQQSGVT
jgi:hypothetical protein